MNDELNKRIIKILFCWDIKKLDTALKYLLELREFMAVNIPVSSLTFSMLDFMTDEGMWNWVEIATKQSAHNSRYDLEAAYLTFQSLSEMHIADQILLRTT